MKITLRIVNRALQARGMKPLANTELLARIKSWGPLKLTRKDRKKIEKALQKRRIVCLHKSSHGKIMLINPRFVKLAPRYNFEIKGKAKIAALKRQSEIRQNSVAGS